MFFGFCAKNQKNTYWAQPVKSPQILLRIWRADAEGLPDAKGLPDATADAEAKVADAKADASEILLYKSDLVRILIGNPFLKERFNKDSNRKSFSKGAI